MAYQTIPPNPRVFTTTLAAANTNVTVSGLNGDVSRQYNVEGELFIDQANVGISFRPNSQTSNLLGLGSDVITGAASDASQGATWNLGRAATSPFLFTATSKIYISGIMRAVTGRVRYLQIECFATSTAAAFTAGYSRDNFIVRGAWTDTATNLTSFQVNSTVASGFGIGSWVSLAATNNS